MNNYCIVVSKINESNELRHSLSCSQLAKNRIGLTTLSFVREYYLYKLNWVALWRKGARDVWMDVAQKKVESCLIC